MAPLTPSWVQPSHPDIQEVIVTGNAAEFTTKSISKISLPPFGLFAKLDFPPCTEAPEPTYATVQMGRDKHLDLNSDLLYINHSCEPSLIFDMAAMNIIAGPKGLKPGDELTFFYPSTEWYMAQPFDCLCGTPSCRGRIAGARDMTAAQLEGVWLNRHIRDLLEERDRQQGKQKAATNGGTNGTAATNGSAPAQQQALRAALAQAEKLVETLRQAAGSLDNVGGGGSLKRKRVAEAGVTEDSPSEPAGLQRRGPTSRELSGEMGGDTSAA
ncbi:hypothetical protein VTJ83DRAFT_6580 [Remersonia thermophila]|uniref:Post-SET domain-containing protein n=1 Tax=Remersonia thermophila TaxID=72144 RepID=A0ABR4D550_9PEZI